MNSQRYVSKELTHFVGRNQENDDKRYELFIDIIKSGYLGATIGQAEFFAEIFETLKVDRNAKISDNEMFCPDMVCFCDIPLESMKIHISKYKSFGIAFFKSYLSKKGATPLSYVARNSKSFGTNISRAEYFDAMFQDILELEKLVNTSLDFNKLSKIKDFLFYEVFSYIKFFDEHKDDTDEDNYYMEREWRLLSGMNFEIDDICRIILPKKYIKQFRKDISNYKGVITSVESILKLSLTNLLSNYLDKPSIAVSK